MTETKEKEQMSLPTAGHTGGAGVAVGALLGSVVGPSVGATDEFGKVVG
jgi:hypothetical protein